MHERNLEMWLKRNGEPQGGGTLTQDQLSYVETHLPAAFVDFLKTYGFGGMFDNGWQLCDPKRFRSLAALIFKADPDFSHNTAHIVGFSAFGELAVWSEQHWVTKVDLLKYTVTCRRLAPPIFNIPIPAPRSSPKPTANSIVRGVLPFEAEAREFWDRDGSPLFARCASTYGPLELGECYGFVPSLGATGYNSKYRNLAHIQRVSAIEHFTIIAQLKPFHLTRLNLGENEIIREIG